VIPQRKRPALPTGPLRTRMSPSLARSDAEGVIHLKDDHRAMTEVIELP
jgi:hypothetical protein